MSLKDFLKKVTGLASEEELKESEPPIPAEIREAYPNTMEAIQEDLRGALDNKNVQGFCNCSTAADRADSNWSTLSLRATGLDGTCLVRCWKCDGLWVANYSKDDQGNVTFSNVKKAQEIIVTAESNREPEETEIQESAVTLREGLGMDANGVIKDACIIQPGWGSSGYYGADVLQKEAASFTGLQMFVDHPTSIEESTIPERSVKNLAAVTTNTIFKENGWKGPGIYGDVKVFSDFQEPIKEKAPFIGLSLYGRGKAKIGEAEGKTGKIIESIPFKRSVDFVTVAGAGGALMPLLESTRKPKEVNPKEPVKESVVVDIKESSDKEMIGLPVNEQEFSDLKESVSKVIAENVTLRESITKVTNENVKLKEKDMLREAASVVTRLVESAKVPQVIKNRLNRQCLETPLTESGDLDTAKLTESVKTAIADAEAEIAELTESGKIMGMGGAGSEPAGIKESVRTNLDSMFGLEPKKEEK